VQAPLRARSKVWLPHMQPNPKSTRQLYIHWIQHWLDSVGLGVAQSKPWPVPAKSDDKKTRSIELLFSSFSLPKATAEVFMACFKEHESTGIRYHQISKDFHELSWNIMKLGFPQRLSKGTPKRARQAAAPLRRMASLQSTPRPGADWGNLKNHGFPHGFPSKTYI